MEHRTVEQIHTLHVEDEKHHLNEIRKLDHIKFYRPIVRLMTAPAAEQPLTRHLQAYRTQDVPFGTNYFGKVSRARSASAVAPDLDRFCITTDYS